MLPVPPHSLVQLEPFPLRWCPYTLHLHFEAECPRCRNKEGRAVGELGGGQAASWGSSGARADFQHRSTDVGLPRAHSMYCPSPPPWNVCSAARASSISESKNLLIDTCRPERGEEQGGRRAGQAEAQGANKDQRQGKQAGAVPTLAPLTARSCSSGAAAAAAEAATAASAAAPAAEGASGSATHVIGHALAPPRLDHEVASQGLQAGGQAATTGTQRKSGVNEQEGVTG